MYLAVAKLSSRRLPRFIFKQWLNKNSYILTSLLTLAIVCLNFRHLNSRKGASCGFEFYFQSNSAQHFISHVYCILSICISLVEKYLLIHLLLILKLSYFIPIVDLQIFVHSEGFYIFNHVDDSMIVVIFFEAKSPIFIV